MVEKVTQGEEDARTQIGRRGNLWVGSGRRSWWLESYKEVVPTSGWRFKDASTWTTAVERGWRQKQAWSPFLKYHRTGALFRLCEYDGLVH